MNPIVRELIKKAGHQGARGLRQAFEENLPGARSILTGTGILGISKSAYDYMFEDVELDELKKRLHEIQENLENSEQVRVEQAEQARQIEQLKG
jgi:hypothetical protein